MGAVGNSEGNFRGTGSGFAGAGSSRCQRGIHRWQLRPGEKGGAKVGKTKRGKGTKIMAVADSHGLPVGLSIESASPHQVKLVDSALVQSGIAEAPQNLVGDHADDSDNPDAELMSPLMSRSPVGVEVLLAGTTVAAGGAGGPEMPLSERRGRCRRRYPRSRSRGRCCHLWHRWRSRTQTP